MIHLGKGRGMRQFLHNSTSLCMSSYRTYSERECEDSNNSHSAGSGVPALDSDFHSQPIAEASSEKEPALPEEPTTCCMSGCANCVWIEYADQVCKLFKSGEKARQMVLSKVSDPNMKAFLLMELKALENMNSDRTS